MTNNTRGCLMALVAVAAFVGVTQLLFHPLRPPPPPAPAAPPPPPPRPFAFGENAKMCSALASVYVHQWEAANECTEDEQCVVETQSPTWSGTDECFRFGNKDANHEVTDKLAVRWRGYGCLDPQLSIHQACPVTPDVQCRRGRCASRASSTSGWKRHTLVGQVRLLLPPDFEGAHGEKTRTFEGKARTLAVTLTREGSPLSATSIVDKSTKIVGQQTTAIDGYSTALFVVEDRHAAAKPGAPARRFRAITELIDAGGPENRLIFELSCETRAACEALPAILEQADLLLTSSVPRQAAGATPR